MKYTSSRKNRSKKKKVITLKGILTTNFQQETSKTLDPTNVYHIYEQNRSQAK